MKILFQSLIAAIASGSFTLLYNATLVDAILGGTVGGLGWFVYSLTAGYGTIAATLISALVIGLTGRIISRIRHIPSQPLIIGGIVVLVPGFTAFKAMNFFIIGEASSGTNLMLDAFLVAASIGTGLIVAVAITSIIFRTIKRR